MGDARAVVQMRSGDKGDKKKKQAPETEATPVPDKALDSPGEAMAALGQAQVGRLVSTLQAAGGNTAVQTELAGLEEGHGAAVKAKAEALAFKVMTDGQKVAHLAEKHGGQLPESSGKQPPPEGTPPDGMAQPAGVVGFHQQRAAQLGQLATAYAAMQGRANQIAAMAGLDPASQAAFAQAAAYFAQVGGEYTGLAATYGAVSADLAANEFAGLAAPPITAAAMYQERITILQEQQAALNEAAAAQLEKASAQDAQIATKEAEIASLSAQKAELDKSIAAAGAAAKGGDKGGAGGGAAAAGGGAGAKGGDKASSSSSGGASGGGAAAGGGGGGDQVGQLTAQSGKLMAQIDQARQARQALSQKKGTMTQLSAVLTQNAVALDQLIGAYNALIGGGAAAPTGRPAEGGK